MRFALALCWMVSLGAAGLCPLTATAQEYPARPIRLVSPGPGGGADFVARALAQGMAGPLGQQVVVENRPAGVIPGQVVSKMPPDGYTLLVNGNSFWTAPLIQGGISYDTVRDFAPITLAVSSPNILIVHNSVPARSVKELIRLARARPGVLNYGSAALGGSVHLSAELFKFLARVDMVRVTYKTSGAIVTAILSGEVDLVFANAPPVMSHIRSGRMRALAVTTAQPSALLPGVPTIAGEGLPGFEVASVYGLFAPAKTPAGIVGRLNQEAVRYLGRADTKEKFLLTGVEPVGSSPNELAATILAEMARMGKVIKAAGIRKD